MQPIVNLVSNFDANKEYEFTYTYLGSERILTNELSIREDKVGSSPVYTRTSTKFDKNHILPSGKLQNGKSYLVKIRVELEGSWSVWSPEVAFTCLTTPKYTFENLQEEKFVYNNDVLMRIIFQQEQGDRVDTFNFVLMDQNRVPITKYPMRRPESNTPNVLQERISDLVKGKLYYIGCYVTTLKGIQFFDAHEFIPHFVAPGSAGVVEVQNQADSGQVMVQAFLRQHTGIQTTPYISEDVESIPSSYVFLNGEWIVIPPHRPLMYKKMGMAKASDFVLKLWCKNVTNGTFLHFTEEDGNGIGIKFVKHRDYITVEKEFLNDGGNGIVSRTKSNTIPNLGLKEFYLYVKVFEFRVHVEIIPIT